MLPNAVGQSTLMWLIYRFREQAPSHISILMQLKICFSLYPRHTFPDFAYKRPCSATQSRYTATA